MEESSNWVVQNLQNALSTWNDKLSEIWLLITQSPEEFKDGTIWNVITNIHGALQAIGYSLLVLFRCRCYEDLRKLCRNEKTGDSSKNVHPFYTFKSSY